MSKFLRIVPWSKYIAGFLIFTLLFLQTIRVEFFNSATAKEEDYRDIVSIFVDTDTYASLRPKIRQYAEDIQSYLWETQVEMYIVDSWISPAQIAARNEKLYYEWDDKKGVSRLVGTILIGNLPVPMVSDGWQVFPSLYPYVDFVDKVFVYNERSMRYELPPESSAKVTEADIWHGVINPAVGRSWQGTTDRQKIAQFLDKTHLFYTKSGRFAPTGQPPRVFYYDGEYERESVNFRSLFQYTLGLQNAENIAYKRFTKYLLWHLNTALLAFDASQNSEVDDYLSELGITGSADGLDQDTIKDMPDIHTKVPIQAIIKDFQSIINKNTLSEALANIYNAWRYNSGTYIRADLAPLQMTVMDELARTTLKEANNALMLKIDQSIQSSGFARKIPLSESVVALWTWATYDTYFFGRKSSTITEAAQCSIARWSNTLVSQFWKDVLVEANIAYDITKTEWHADKLRKDTEELVNLHKSNAYVCFDTNTWVPKTQNYWWWNTLLRVVSDTTPEDIMNTPPGDPMLIKWFSEDIFSLGGMKETTRLTPPTLMDCTGTKYQYALKRPYTYQYDVVVQGEVDTLQSCEAGYPWEWNRSIWYCPQSIEGRTPRYTCLSTHDILNPLPFDEALKIFPNKPCFAGTMKLDGVTVATANNTCIETIGSWEDFTQVDKTVRENWNYRTIPGFLKHISPTDDEIAAAETNGVTPSLPVDMVRYLEFLTPKGNIARINYPNFFEAPLTDRASVRTWLKTLSESQWNNIIQKENSTSYTPLAANIEALFVSTSLPSSPFDWNSSLSDESIDMILRARNWLNPDVTKKYKQAIETSLSYSREYPWKNASDQTPKYPLRSEWYDIAYLWLFPFEPSSEENIDDEMWRIQNEYELGLSAIHALNVSEPYQSQDQNPYGNSDKCGPPEWVNIFQWPAAIMCWIQSLTPPRIIAGSCSTNTIGLSNNTWPLLSPTPSTYESVEKQKSFYEGGKLIYRIDRTSLRFHDTVEAWFEYVKENQRLVLPERSRISVEILSLQNEIGQEISKDLSENYLRMSPSTMAVTDAGGKTLFASRERQATANIRAVLDIVLSDGSIIQKVSDPINIRVTPEYLQVSPKNKWAITSAIDVTDSTNAVNLDISRVKDSGDLVLPSYPISYTLIDDVSGRVIFSWGIINNADSSIDMNLLRNIGVYRFVLQDTQGLMGETTFSVESGKVAKITANPISSMIRAGANTLMMITLQDAQWNPTSPDLEQITVQVSGGYIADSLGEKKTEMTIDTLENSLSLLIWSDSAGTIQYKITTKSGYETAGRIDVVDAVRVVLLPASPPKVGESQVSMKLKVTDRAGNTLTWFSSVASINVPPELWTILEGAIDIRNGITEEFDFIPGTKAGKHRISLDIPGLGTLQNTELELLPGTPLYMTHELREDLIDFSVRDRYGNRVGDSFNGTLRFNTESQQSITFTGGVYSLPKVGWFYTVHIPSLASQKITYTDASGNHDISGIPYYATYVLWEKETFDFLPDYNARYTVLYGESFLRESEDILFDTNPVDSQSLAVTTLLDSPYDKNEVLSVAPGGKIQQANYQDDMLLESSVSILNGYPVINFYDSISMRNIARIFYPVSNPILKICPGECMHDSPKNRARIEVSPETSIGFEAVRENDGIVLKSAQTPFFRIESDGKISSLYAFELKYISDSGNGALFEIITGGTVIGYMRMISDQTQSIQREMYLENTTAINTPIIDTSSSISHQSFSEESLSASVVWYRFILPSKDRILSESMIGPSGIDSYGETYENPGIGWQGSNTSLLSYAWGDTVWEATKWFHTYTMINLGDPVAHVDNMAPGTHSEWIERSIGTRVTSSQGLPLISYSLRDMDKDGLDDIVTLDTGWWVHLVLNRGTRIRYKEQIAYLPDVTERWLSIADTTADGYGDIVALDKEGTFIFIDNDHRRFTRKKMIIENGTIPQSVSQFKIFDMDNDFRDDIIYLTESWELGILYGTATWGTFTKNILESTLGITLSSLPESAGWALKFDGLVQIPADQFWVSTGDWSELDESILQSEVYSQYNRIIPTPSDQNIDIHSNLSSLETQFDQTLNTPESTIANSLIQTYIKSQYAPWYDLEVARSFRNISHTYLQTGDTIEAQIVIKNTGTQPKKNITYLDTIPDIFDSSSTQKYDLIIGNEKMSRDFQHITTGEYDAYFEWRDLEPWQTLTIRYELKALPMKHGNMIVGKLEKWESWDDVFGDVGFEASETCGDDMIIWRSWPSARQYTRGTRSFATLDIPEALKKQIQEVNKYADATNLTSEERASLRQDFDTITKSSTSASRSLVSGNINTANNVIDLGFDAQVTANIESMMQDFFDGLSCGFWWGSCMSFPINWAPLAPGSAPSIFWYPIAPLIPETGIPLFSSLTWQQFMCGPKPCCLPSAFPASVQWFWVGVCTAPSAGWKLGTWDVTNAVRMYLTPTLTLGMWAAMCFKWPASVTGRIPPPPLFGLIKWWNCIVVAKPMPFCKWDGSKYDGDVTGFSGLWTTRDTWNANSCQVSISTKNTQRTEDREIQQSVIGYLKNPNTTKRKSLYEQINNRTARTATLWPALRIGGNASSGTEVGIEIDSSKPFNLGNIVKVKNGRVPAFPDFLMNWVTRQTEEIVNALFTAPSLVVIWPGIVWANMQFDGNWQNFQKRFTDAYSAQSFENLKTQMWQAYTNSNLTASLQKSIGSSGKSSLAKDFRQWSNQALSGGVWQTINNIGGWLASVRAAYTFIWQLPFLNIRRTTVNIDVPWILPGELDKYIKAYENYVREYDRMMTNWCVWKTPQECADAKILLNSSGFMSSLKQNLKILNDYKNFPQKLQKYVTWKQRYMSELLCNVETVRQVLGGWIKDNGVRFKKWAELFVLLKAIAESWQPLIDIFSDTSKKCGVCTNQRYNSMHWKLKLLSAVIPSPPIIRFPRWPDIVLDLSDIRLGINVSVPDFRLNVKPLRLPSLPNLTLPNSPNLALTLPSLPILPALPNLPDLPSLPSLPRLALPNLPPPPKVPKLLGSIQAVLKIFKLLSTVYCFLNNTMLVPEGEVGDVIAKRTERQGKLSLDFIGIQFPNFTLPWIREIRISTHVNFELRSDFITEFAKQAVKPINEFTTDLGRGIPKKVWPDVNLWNPTKTINIWPQSQSDEMTEVLASLQNIEQYFEKESSTLLDVDTFKTFLLNELERAWFHEMKRSALASIKKAEKTSEALIDTLIERHEQKYDALTDYIQAEYDATGEMQHIIDILNGKDSKLLSYTWSDIRQFVMSDDSKVTSYLARYDALNTPEVIMTSYDTSVSHHETKTLPMLARLERLAASSLVDSPTNTQSSPDIPNGYLPVYKGIYVLTPSGVQTRLFDADITIDEHHEVTSKDIDKDGDTDYVYILDGAVYVKYTWASKRSLHTDTTLSITPLREDAPLPTTPDYFHETINAPKSLSLTFAPAQEEESDWRLEFYDRYLEWDQVELEAQNDLMTPRHIVDISATDITKTSQTNIFEVTPVNHILASIGSPDGFQMNGVKVTVLKSGETFHLPVGKKIVTGESDARILVLEWDAAGTTLDLLRAGSYAFKNVVKARIISGKLYSFGTFTEEWKYTYSDDYQGMPIIASLRMTAPDGGMRVRYIPTGEMTTLNKWSQYAYLPLGSKSPDYYINLSYPDGVYSARIKSLDTEQVLTNVSLFAPQIASDKSDPIIDFPDNIRIPVYSTVSFPFDDFISEMSSYRVRIDPDTSKDQDNNGIYDDDFTLTGTNIQVNSKSLTFQAHTTLETYTALMEVVDEMGNTSRKAFNVEIYAPIPTIQAVTNTGWTNGRVSENLRDEPIHLFRVRPGTDIVPINNLALKTDGEGIFASGTFFGASGAIFTSSWILHKLNEHGVVEVDSQRVVTVTPADTKNPMKFTLRNAWWVPVYEQFMILPKNTIISPNIPSSSSTGLFIQSVWSSEFIPAVNNDPNIPRGYYLIDSQKRAIALLAQDGNIYLTQPSHRIDYTTRDGYIFLTLREGTQDIATFWYKVDFFYTIK